MKKTIKLDMNDFQQRKQYGRTPLTQKEKEARIYALADKMKIKIGDKNDINTNANI